MLLLSALSAFGPFVVDLYLPALPALPDLAAYFDSSTSMVQMTLTTGMIGLAVGQLLFGPLSDKYGRKIPLLVSLAVYIVSTVAIVFAPDMETLIALRFVQGFMAAGGVVVSRAVVADLYHGREMTRFFGLLMTVNGLAPIVSPVIGSAVLGFTDWWGMFVLLALIGAAAFAGSARLYESLPSEKRLATPLSHTFATLFKVVKNRTFILFVAVESFAFGGMFAYISASPFVFQEYYGLSSFMFSLCFAANGAALVVGSNLGGRLQNATATRSGVFGSLLMGLGVAAVLVTQGNVWLLEAGLFLMLLFIGLMLPALSALAMSAERRYAGSASALLGFLVFMVGAVVSPLVGIGNIFYATATVIVASKLLMLASYWAVRGKIAEEADETA
ncbi:Bcr/CflA family efflux MFS transporter [Neisseria animalis]|uniref:Bcr/CflA family efflux transporter n=1 Tax=Neisseria animalis TaxID=492 RepID=A0A5P3MW62_NEIAN|nr:Bcr/CflA family efflux MFS transporter [Neisseria animalis]ROW32709.1 Bcr/CflA family efflux MFS transporter [Neisseria animalis]